MNENYRFHPSAVFKRIDRLRMNKLNSYDIANFLRDNGHNVHSVDLSDMIRAFDNDNDGYLDLQEF